jgi:hypothetical protein
MKNVENVLARISSMATDHGFWWGRPGLICIVLFCMTGTVATRAADSATSPDEAYLDALQGAWVIAGTLGGKPVRYFADGQRVLQGGFMKLHMIDAGSRPQYEADVFIGFDAKANDYIAHWLDRFGAPGARVVARGERQGQRLVLIFPYADGAFRDTFTWQPESKSWSLLLESQGGNGAWSTFASYSLIRGAPR